MDWNVTSGDTAVEGEFKGPSTGACAANVGYTKDRKGVPLSVRAAMLGSDYEVLQVTYTNRNGVSTGSGTFDAIRTRQWVIVRVPSRADGGVVNTRCRSGEIGVRI